MNKTCIFEITILYKSVIFLTLIVHYYLGELDVKKVFFIRHHLPLDESKYLITWYTFIVIVKIFLSIIGKKLVTKN